MRLIFFVNLLLVFVVTVCSPAGATGWQVVDDTRGQGVNAWLNIRLNLEKPVWASLIVDFGTGRNCSAGLGFLLYRKRDLGRQKNSKKNPDVSMAINIDGQKWNQQADLMRLYENGFEVDIAIYSQEMLNALANGRAATVSVLVKNVPKANVAFNIEGGLSAISQAYERCLTMLR